MILGGRRRVRLLRPHIRHHARALWKVSIRGKIMLIIFTPMPIGFVSSPYTKTEDIPKGLGMKHEAEGTLEILPEFGLGLTDIEGFSHLIVLWAFDRYQGFELLGTPPRDDRPHGGISDPVPKTSKSQGSQLSNFSAVIACCCTSEASTCSTERPFST
jgi:hypothetical protein